MAKLQTIGKKEIQSINKPFDEMTSKADKILKKLSDEPDDTLYYIASLNLLSRPLTLFGKEVKSFSSTNQIKVSKEQYYQLKSNRYFKNEVPKEDSEGKKLIGVEYIDSELVLQKHKNIDNIFKQQIEEPPITEQLEHEPISHELTPSTSTSTTSLAIKKEREPSKYQKEIFNYITWLVNNDPRATNKHIVIEAVAGCISGNSIIYTNNGLITIKELYAKKSKNIKVACSDRNGGTEFKEIDEYFKLENKDIIKITTKFGFELKCTPEHKLLNLDKNGVLKFEEAKNLNINDTISIYYNANSFGENQKMRWDVGQSLMSDYLSEEESEKLPEMNKGIINYGTTGGRISGKNVACTYPYIMNEELAEFLGYFISEGNINRDITVNISNTDNKINERVTYLYKNLFNLDSNIILEKRKENIDYGRTVNSVGLSRFLELIGLNEKSKNKEIPKEILMSSKEIHISFLKALFSGDGYIVKDKKMVGYSSMSENLCKQIQLMLLNLGIYSNLDDKVAYCNDKCCGKSYFISISGTNAISYRDLIDFTLEYKQNELIEICKHIEEDGIWNSRTLKGLGSYISKIYEEFKKLGRWNDIREYYIDAYETKAYECYSAHDAIIKRGCSDIRNYTSEKSCPSKQKLYKILIAMKECNYMDEYKYLMNLCNLNIEYESIESIEYGKEDVYDLNIRDFHHYIANGFVVHNSGKTWTIEHATKLIPPTKSVVFLAFNVTIKDELAKRAPKHVRALTLNGAGYESLRYALKLNGKHGTKVDPINVKNILDGLFKDKYKFIELKEIDMLKPLVNRLVSLYKATGLQVNMETFKELSSKHALLSLFEDEFDSNNVISLVKDVLNINSNILTNNWNAIDFDDQIWLPVTKNLPIEKYDFVFVDETQDLNATQLELVMRMCKKQGSIIAVGDRNQSIYQFRGADTEAIPHIIEKLNAKIFPLSITYRCPKSVTILAQTLVPEIEYATIENAGYEALEGEIIHTTSHSITDLAKPKDRIICRNSAPLVHPCFELIKAGKKATILGREIGENLIKLMEEIKGNNIDDFMFRLNRWYDNKREKLEEKMQFEALDRITDQYETLLVLSEDCESIECILFKIKTIFSEDKESITFSTIHKAKGLEAETIDNSIFIIMSHKGRQLIPSPYAKTEEQQQQESNLLYVAYTRAKNKLYLVD